MNTLIRVLLQIFRSFDIFSFVEKEYDNTISFYYRGNKFIIVIEQEK